MKMRFRSFQRWLADHFHREVWRWRTRVALAEDAGFRALYAKIGEKLFAHDWGVPVWPYVEPTKDVQADMFEEAACLNSPRRIMARNGLEIDDISREIVADNERRIGRAIRASQRLKKKYDVEVDWHEILSKPLPQGMTMRVMGQEDLPPGEEGAKAAETKSEDAATTAAAKGP
jgi:capsid protein